MSPFPKLVTIDSHATNRKFFRILVSVRRFIPDFIGSISKRIGVHARADPPLEESARPAPTDPTSDVTQFDQARAFHQQGLLNEAEAIYRSLLLKHPGHSELLQQLGVLHGQRNQLVAAIEFIDQAIAADPYNASAHGSRGNCLKGLGKHEEALASYNRALALQPNDANVLSNRGATLGDLKQHEQALESYDRALGIDPHHVAALDNRGTTLRALQRLEDALASHERALAINSGYVSAQYHRGLILKDLKRLEDARASLEQTLVFDPGHIDALMSLGIVLGEMQQYDATLAVYDRALKLRPNDPALHYQRGCLLHIIKHHEEALASYQQALQLRPEFTEALVNFGATLREVGRHQDALSAFARAIELAPDHSAAHYYRAITLSDLRRHDEALTSFDLALTLDWRNPEIHGNRGITLQSLHRHEEASASFEHALNLHPNSCKTLINYGASLMSLNRHAAALRAFDQALTFEPDHAIAHTFRGVALSNLRQYEDALKSYDRALDLKPEYVDAHNNRGAVLNKLRRGEDALESYEKALELNPDHLPALFNRGNLLWYLKRSEDAAKDFARVVALEPEYDFAQGDLLNARMSCCDWRDINTLFSSINEGIQQGKKNSEPFRCVSIANSPMFLKRCAEVCYTTKSPSVDTQIRPIKRRNHDKIRVGYVAGEFREHATSILMVDLFERHDTQRFELFGFDNGWDDGSNIRKRLNNAFTKIVDISRWSDVKAATEINNMDIDILVDLNGHIGLKRKGVFSLRPAPVQVNWLGYPGSTGVPYMDYIIGDAIIIPKGHEDYYSEKVVRLPHTYQVNDSKRVVSERTPSRGELGLPESGFVFCCFNSSYKITPDIFEIWMRLLGKVDDSVLWLLEDNAAAARNLRAEATARGVKPERLVFAQRTDLPNHLARHRLADLFLDTLPCNAHTTASDALWAGLPVLTCMGNTFAGRVAASLLHAVGLPDLITENLADYETLALKLATTPGLLANLQARLVRNKTTSPLFDTDRFRRHIESAYVTMHEVWTKGESPKSFDVDVSI